MTKFTAGGRDWQLRLTAGALADVREDAGVPLGELLAPDKAKDLAELVFGHDAERVVRVLWVLCEEQAQAAGVTDRQFGRLFDRDTLDAARQALAVAVTGFYQSRKVTEVMARNLPAILAKADEIQAAELEKRTAAFLSGTSSGSAGNSPGSSGSTPAP